MRFKTEVGEANVFIIAVPTPLDKEMKMAELRFLCKETTLILE